MSGDPITRLNVALKGRYRIERELGEGGMATVYLADDLKHERKVALKVLKPELAAVVGGERFLAEIKTTAKLQHPHILPLHDSGDADGFVFYVMPYVEGESLRDKLDREKQLGVDDALAITQKVAGALDYAHGHGVVHRDIKPGNILLSAQGEPLVADFGIALAVAQAGAGRITETGLSLGTPHYMSPEQATGDRDVDPRSDVYALGCVLYEMLAGQPPFSATTAQAVLVKILTMDAPSITSERRTVPPHVGHALAKSLEKLPADRFTSAAEFATALADTNFTYEARARTPVAAPTPEPVATQAPITMPGPWKRLTMVGWSLAAVTTLGFAWSLLRPDPPQPVARQVLSTEGWAGLQAPLGRVAALAPDGSSMILPMGSSGGDRQLGLKMRGSTEITPIPGTEQALEVVYSPDAQWIAYQVGADVLKRPLVGGSPVTLAEDANPSGVSALAWLDDGSILYEAEDESLDVVRWIARISEDGEPLGIVFGPEEEQVAPAWARGLPGARGALVIGCPGTAACLAVNANLYVVDLDDLSWEIALEQVMRAWYAPTGHIVYVRADGAVFAQPFDAADLELMGSVIPLFDGVRVPGTWADMLLAADGTLLYAEGSAVEEGGGAVQRLLVVDLDGNEEALPLAPRPINTVSWAPDGRSVAYSFLSGPGTPHDLYTYNVTLGTTPRQLTFEGANQNGVFSPDGTRIAFNSEREGTDDYDLFVKTLDDDVPARSIITLERNQEPTQWPLDTLLVFESGGGPGDRDLWMLNLSNPDSARPEAYLSSEANLRAIMISPDGTLAAYASNETGVPEVYIRSFPDPGERTPVSQGGGRDPRWSPDGNTVYYWRIESPSGRTFMAARIQRQPTPVVLSTDSLFTREFVAYDLHPEGDRLVVAQNVTTATVSEGGAAEPQRLILVTNWFEELRQRVPN